jgi:uncharacterized protein (TIGR02145 family)
MSINLGNTNIGSLYLGSTKIGSAYLGSTKVYESIQPGPSFDEVTIGIQTWMAKNLTIDDGQGGIYTHTVNYGQGDVVEYYYTWEAAVRIAASIPGWHLPSDAEWNTLANAVGGTSVAGTKLKSTTGWSSGNGTDDFGFSVFPAGYQYSGSFNNLGSNALFWTATEYSSSNAYCRYFYTGASTDSYRYPKSFGFSVRLVKDAT